MRHLITLAAVAALAGCTVDVEGAACRVPGTADDCPAGQACGLDFTCSEAAAGCDVCNPGDRACKDNKVMECTAAISPVCGSWSVLIDDCAADQLACPDGAAPVCVCPPHLESPVVLHADPNAATRQGLNRNGAVVSVCRYLSLNDALTVATNGNTVKAAGFAGVPVVFTEPPLTIPAGVSVTTDDATPNPANYVVEIEGAGSQGVRLEAGASLAGVTLRRGTDGPALGARVVGSSPTGRGSLLTVRVDALGVGLAFATGVRVEGAGTAIADAVTLDDIGIQGASGNGLEVAMDAVDDTVAAASALLESNNVGIKLSKGDLTLTHPTVKASAAEGINADIPALNTAKLNVQDGKIQRNGTVGLWLGRLAGLNMERTRVCGNAGSSRTLSGETRKVGGIFALGAAPSALSLVFSGNSIHDNGGDQVFIGAGSGWNLSSPSCASGVRNLVVGYVDVGSVGVSEIGAVVEVRNWEWATASTPEPGVDFYASPQGGSVDAIGTGGDFCLPPIPAQPPVCPP